MFLSALVQLADNKPPNQWVIKSIEFAQAAKTDCCLELGQWQIGSAFLESEVGRVAVVVGHHRSLVRLLARSRSVRGLRRRRRSVVGELQFNWKVKLERICESPCTFAVEHSSMNLGECLHLSMPTMPTRRRTPSAGTETGYLHFPNPHPQSCKWRCFGIEKEDGDARMAGTKAVGATAASESMLFCDT